MASRTRVAGMLGGWKPSPQSGQHTQPHCAASLKRCKACGDSGVGPECVRRAGRGCVNTLANHKCRREGRARRGREAEANRALRAANWDILTP